MKPRMTFDFRISTYSGNDQRYTEDEIRTEIRNGNVRIDLSGGGKVPLLVRNTDGAVMGEFLV